jgi:hypothetical protein
MRKGILKKSVVGAVKKPLAEGSAGRGYLAGIAPC